MERIENVLRRIQELYYSRHEKTGIDIDLMLDYTRVMYADLLEWRKRFKDELPVSGPAAAPEPEPATPEAPESAVTEDLPVQPDPEQIPAGAAAPVEDTATAQPAQPAEHDTPAETLSGPEKEEAEAEVVKEVQHNNPSAISFEPPAPQPLHTVEIEDVLEEDEPAVNTPVENIVLPEVEPEAAVPVKPAIQATSGPVLRKDIRGAIGINDKYLFLNELFANNKTDYEEALDQLRLFDDYGQALSWLQAHPAQKNGWDKEDDMVQSFLALVKQYLSSR